MYIIPELWEIIKDFLIVKPSEKSFPPYVWIHIKDYMLQEYWMRQFNSALKELPKYKTFLYPNTSLLLVSYISDIIIYRLIGIF